MIHLLINTGVSRVVPISEIRPEALATLRPLLDGGDLGAVMAGLSQFRISVDRQAGAAAFTIIQNDEQVLSVSMCAWDARLAAGAWELIEKTYLDLSDKYPS